MQPRLIIRNFRQALGILKHAFRPTMRAALRWLSRNQFEVASVLDVGASDGRWSLQCMQFYPCANYVLFEPNPVHAKRLEQFGQRHRGQVEIVKEAVGEQSGQAWFDDSDAFGGALADDDKAHGLAVTKTSLDDCVARLGIQSPLLLKLDTHGFEAGILNGASKTLEACSVLIIEAYNHYLTSEGVTFWELCAKLADLGFRPVDLVDVMHRKHDDSLWQMDIVFVRQDWPGFQHRQYL